MWLEASGLGASLNKRAPLSQICFDDFDHAVLQGLLSLVVHMAVEGTAYIHPSGKKRLNVQRFRTTLADIMHMQLQNMRHHAFHPYLVSFLNPAGKLGTE
jgi:hypothetical protein